MSAVIDYGAVPKLPHVESYLALGCSPGGARRNFESYGHKIGPIDERRRQVLCDPQTSGGLLVAVTPDGEAGFLAAARELGLALAPIGELGAWREDPLIEVSA